MAEDEGNQQESPKHDTDEFERQLSIAEYSALRDEIVESSHQKTAYDLALFTITIAVATLGVQSAFSGDTDTTWPQALVCLSGYLFTGLLYSAHERKDRSMRRCAAYILVNFTLTDCQALAIESGEKSFDDVIKNPGLKVPWEIDYRKAIMSIDNVENDGKPQRKALGEYHLLHGTFRGLYILLAAISSFSAFLCLVVGCGFPNLDDSGSMIVLIISAALLLATIVIAFIKHSNENARENSHKEAIQGGEMNSKNDEGCCVESAGSRPQHTPFDFFYELSGEVLFAAYASEFLKLRCDRLNNSEN